MEREKKKYLVVECRAFSHSMLKHNDKTRGAHKCIHSLLLGLTRFSGLCSSCVVDAHRVMRDLNMQPTTTASILWARDLSPPVAKLFPKPALSENI